MGALKDRPNAGESPEMYFYRDSGGNEVDLLLLTCPPPHNPQAISGAV